MHGTAQLARRLDRIDDRFRFARLSPSGLQPVGQPAHPLTNPDQSALDAVELSRDPAKGNKIDDKSLKEAAVAVLAVHLGVLTGVQREATGHSEFCDDQQRNWDVKSPISPDRPGWIFDPHHQLEVVQEDLDQGEGILLDLTDLNPTDSRSLLQEMAHGLSLEQSGHVLVLLDQNLLH